MINRNIDQEKRKKYKKSLNVYTYTRIHIIIYILDEKKNTMNKRMN
jgi:hypothetical protein